MYTLPGLLEADLQAAVADVILGYLEKFRKVAVGKSVLLRADEHSVRGNCTLHREERFLLLDELLHLLDEPLLHAGRLVDLVHRRTLAECLIHLEMSLARRRRKLLQQLLLRELMEILHIAEAVTSGLKAADCLLEGLLVGLTDAHYLAYSAHLRAEFVLNTLELLKCPAGELDHDIVAARNILVERAAFAAGDVLQGKARCEHSGHQSDREARSLRSECRGTRGSRVDLDDDDTVGNRIVRELNVRTADDLHTVNDLVCLLLQTLLYLRGDRQHRSRAERVTGVYAHRVDVLDEAHGDHIALAVADNLELQLLPTENGLLDENLAYETCLKASRADRAELFLVIYQAAAGAAHRVRGAKHHGVSELVGDRKRLVHTVGDLASCHLDAELVHCILKFDTVLTALDRVDLHADNLHAVLIQHTRLVELCAEVQTGLTAEVRQQRVRTLLRDDALQSLHVERLDVCHVRRLRVGHDRSRVGVNQHDLIAELAKRLTRLRSRVVELARLTDDDRTGSDDQYFVDVCSLRHFSILLLTFVCDFPGLPVWYRANSARSKNDGIENTIPSNENTYRIELRFFQAVIVRNHGNHETLLTNRCLLHNLV